MTCTTKDQLLAGLDPQRPETIQALIDFHRRTFAGFRMEADDDKGGDGGQDDGGKGKDGSKDGADDNDDEALGEGGKKALQRERDARKDLERQVAELKSGQPDLKKLAEALGIKPEGGDKPSAESVTAALQQRLDAMEQENRLYRVAAKHRITDADDLELLKGLSDESAMDKLAARLASGTRDGDDADTKGGRGKAPRADKSQGRGGDGSSRPSSVKQVIEERRAARAAKQQ